MSVFHLPRLYFAGTATTQLPTGPRNGLLDLATNRVLGADGSPFPVERPAIEYDGPAGDHHAGNGHFVVNAVVSGVELRAGERTTSDGIVGRKVEMWGHYNEYLQTTVNRARVFDLDPSSKWTTAVMVGQFGFGSAGRSHVTGSVLTGNVHGVQPPRWHDLRPGGAVVHQFAVPDDELTWLTEPENSPAVDHLGEVLRSDAGGLVVQFALIDPGTPPIPGAPRRWELRGTIAPWYPGEWRTYPAGRLLVPLDRKRAPHVLSVELAEHDVTLNMITCIGRESFLEDLQLRTAGAGKLIAELPRQVLLDGVRSSGLVCVPRAGAAVGTDEALVLVSTEDGAVLSREREVNLQVDDAWLALEHSRHATDPEHDVEVVFRSFVRGRPTAVENVRLSQISNPRALPLAGDAGRAQIARIRCGGQDWSTVGLTSTDADGVGRFTLRGVRAGAARLLLTAGESEVSPDYDNDDLLGFWSGAGQVSLRVLPDDWWLDGIADSEVTFDLLYREIFAPYELQYSFMREEVFSLADRCKVDTYATLIWQMCDPRNKAKTYYMPPTRDLTLPKAKLLLRYLRICQAPDQVLRVLPASERTGRRIGTRAELVSALRDAVTLELTVMLQYLYAAYSVPDHGTGWEYVRAGEWTPRQLEIACGDGGETTAGGIRGTLIRVAREEMIHFLAANNILAALGEPFYAPAVNFGTINAQLPISLDFSLERLSVGSVQRFIEIERPNGLAREVSLGDRIGQANPYEYRYSSISELYGDIRQALQDIPGLFVSDRGPVGGEHHLFLRESVNRRHPDYQMEVDDLASALFAIDVITEQGEGGDLADGDLPGEQSHYEAFRGVAAALHDAEWIPSYPTVRNPTSRRGDRSREYVPDPEARHLMQVFNDAYSVTLQLMVQHFGSRPITSLRRSRLMNVAIDVMTGILRPLGELLVTMPSGLRGRTAGPSFELDSPPVFEPQHDVAMRRVAQQLDDVAAKVKTSLLVPARVSELGTLLAEQLRRT